MAVDRNRRAIMRMRDEAGLVAGFIEGMAYEQFFADEIKKRAVCMVFANIGELEQRLSDAFKAQHSAIPWKAIRKTRNVIAHSYESVKWPWIWDAAINDIPALLPELDRIIADFDREYGPFDFERNYKANQDLLRQAEKEFSGNGNEEKS
jgi:uncharacterized protein with HEPN domain